MNKTDIFSMLVHMLWDAFRHMMNNPLEQGITGLAIVMPAIMFLALFILWLLHYPNTMLDKALVSFPFACMLIEISTLIYALRTSEFTWDNPSYAYLAHTMIVGSGLFFILGIAFWHFLVPWKKTE